MAKPPALAQDVKKQTKRERVVSQRQQREPGRRDALRAIGIGLAIGAAPRPAGAVSPPQAPPGPSLVPAEAHHLARLTATLAELPRRRDFTTVPMILNDRAQWDHAALEAVLTYPGGPKQSWDHTDIGGPWLNLMRNALNTQIWGFRHPDFLTVSVTHGPANLALYDQAAWDKYQLGKLTGDRFKSNTLIVETPAGSADAANYEDPAGAFSSADSTIPALMRRGVVFMSCHNAIWEQADTLIRRDQNPDHVAVDVLAADLTNHLIPGVVLIPGAVGTMPELQQAGFHYAR